MNQLTIEELSAYLPYGVKCNLTRRLFERQNVDLMGLEIAYNIDYFIIKSNVSYGLEHIQLRLRPLSQLTTEIEVNGEKFVPIDVIRKFGLGHIDFITTEREGWIEDYGIDGWLSRLPFGIVHFLISLHFDIFGLLDRNLAEEIV